MPKIFVLKCRGKIFVTKGYKRKSLPAFRPRKCADADAAKAAMIRSLIERFTDRWCGPADCVPMTSETLPSLVDVDYVQQAPDDPGFLPSVVLAAATDRTLNEVLQVVAEPRSDALSRGLNLAVRRKIRFAKKAD